MWRRGRGGGRGRGREQAQGKTGAEGERTRRSARANYKSPPRRRSSARYVPSSCRCAVFSLLPSQRFVSSVGSKLHLSRSRRRSALIVVIVHSLAGLTGEDVVTRSRASASNDRDTGPGTRADSPTARSPRTCDSTIEATDVTHHDRHRSAQTSGEPSVGAFDATESACARARSADRPPPPPSLPHSPSTPLRCQRYR